MTNSLIITIKDDQGNVVSTLVANPKTFKSGSVGFYVGDKITLLNGVRYQVGMNIVEIGSKSRNDKTTTAVPTLTTNVYPE